MTKRRTARRGQPALESLAVRSGALTLADKPRAKPPTDELGAAAGIGYGGFLSSFDADYAAAFQMPTRWQTMDRMATDPAVSASLSALTFPVLAARLDVEPASDDPEDVRLAEFVEAGLNNMTTGLARHRMEALGFVGEGVRVFETVFERREDDLWYPRKLALRPNNTITDDGWLVDEHGGPAGVKQQKPDGAQVELEMDRLLAFTHMGDGPGLLGRPAMRAMYRPWYLIDKLSRVGAIGIERHGVGIPWARYTGSSESEAAKVDRALMGMHAASQGFFRVGDDVPDWGMRGVEGTVMDPVPFLEYQRRDLFLASLAQFLALGTDGVGSMALSQDQSAFFMMAVRFIAAEIEDVYNRHLIPRWIGHNWLIPADRLPRVKHGVIDQRNATEWATGIASAVAAGVQFPPDELARTASRLFGVTIPEAVEVEESSETDGVIEPALLNGIQVEKALDIMGRYRAGELNYIQAETALRAFLAVRLELIPLLLGQDGAKAPEGPGRAPSSGVADVNDPNAPEAETDEGGPAMSAQWTGVDLAGELPSLIALRALGVEVNFAGMSDRLDGAEARIIAALAPLQQRQVNRLLNAAKTIISRGDADALARFTIQSDEEAKAIATVLAGVYDYGAEQVVGELAQQGAKGSKPDKAARAAALALLGVTAAEMARSLADRLRTAWGSAVVGQMRTGYDKAALAEAVTVPGERLLADVARRGPSTALGLGRADVVSDTPVKWVASAAMDRGTCAYCRALDAQEWEDGKQPKVPFADCAGKSRCRCAIIPIVVRGK